MGSNIEVELQETMGSDRAIAQAAWTSSYDKNKKELKNDDDVARVVKMLIKSGHSVPIESVVFRFWWRGPIYLDRQFMTHRLQSASGLSGRYRTLPEDWYSFPADVVQILDKISSSNTEVEEFDKMMQLQHDYYRKSLSAAKNAEKEGTITNDEYKRVREVYRGVLGTATMTERTTTINLRSFANFVRLRTDKHAQFEIQVLAHKMLKCVEDSNVCPIAIATLKENGWIV